MKTPDLLNLFAAVFGIAAFTTPAIAGVIVQPVSVVSSGPADSGNASFIMDNAINQSGLLGSYASGQTDFESFIATQTDGEDGTAGFAFAENGPLLIDFDLGSTANIDALGFWSSSGTAALRTFSLSAALQPDFSDAVDLGTFSVVGGAGRPGETLAFAETAARYVRMEVIENFGFQDAVRLNEIAFRSTAEPSNVPLGGAVAMLFFGFLALGLRRL